MKAPKRREVNDIWVSGFGFSFPKFYRSFFWEVSEPTQQE